MREDKLGDLSMELSVEILQLVMMALSEMRLMSCLTRN